MSAVSSRPEAPLAPEFTAETALPSREKIRALWDEHGMLDNIRKHSEIVCSVALLLTDWLADAGVLLQREAVLAGALLHDIAKSSCLGTRRPHDLEGREALVAQGFVELGELVGAHVVLPEEQRLGETMIVNYADKRVTHTEIVDLEKRFEYIAERYAHGKPKLIQMVMWGKQRAYEAERTIFEAMNGAHTPAEIFECWDERLDEARG